MKSVVLIFTFLLISVVGFGQGNLQFNQVKLVTSTMEAVPVGKVWKLESASYDGAAYFTYNLPGQSSSSVAMMQFSINSKIIILGGSNSTQPNNDSGKTTFPMWLPTGTTLKAGTNVVYLSVIEYNIIP